MKEYIALDGCVHGGIYEIDSRNLSFGVFNSNCNGFIGIRHKFGHDYLFTEYHWDTGEPYGTVKPIKFMSQCPDNILISEELRYECAATGREIKFDLDTKHYKYVDDGSSMPKELYKIRAIENKALFDLLKKIRSENQ